MLRRNMGWLHFDLYFGNLCTLQTEFVDQAWQHLPQLGGDRAGIGVDNNLPQLEIGHAARRGQIGRRDLLENALKFDQPPGMRRQSRQIAGGIQVSV